MNLLTILIVILVISILWVLLKFALKLTVRVFSCGLILILLIGLMMLLFGVVELPTL